MKLLDVFSGCSFTLIEEDGSAITSSYQEGLLLYNGGTVCNDYFSYNSGGAICKEMGFTGLYSWRNGNYWSSRQKTYNLTLDNVRCPSPDWSSCSYLTSHDGDHREDVFLACYILCLPGHYRSSTSINCGVYRTNTYSSSGTTTFCTSCPSGSTSSPGSSRCECPAGKYWSGSLCSSCSSGYYSSIGMESCVRCPSGSSSSSGSSRCNYPSGQYWSEGACLTTTLSCPAGQYHSSEYCYNCAANYYSAGGNTTSCTSCPSGSTSSPGSSRCECPTGKYWYSGSCSNCSSGYYSSIGMESCVRCPEGSTSAAGSGYCSCQAGRYWSEGACKSCIGGSSSPEGALQCIPCPVGSRTLKEGACSCPKGKIWAWSQTRLAGSCSPCQENTYKSADMDSCVSCPDNSTSSQGSVYCFCPAGMYWNETTCLICNDSSASSDNCTCTGGKFWNGKACINCAPGTYKDEFMISCEGCTSNSVSQEGAQMCVECLEEALSDVTHTSCICRVGLIWSWGQNNGSCVSPQSLTSWHSSKYLEIAEVAGISVMAVTILVLGVGC